MGTREEVREQASALSSGAASLKPEEEDDIMKELYDFDDTTDVDMHRPTMTKSPELNGEKLHGDEVDERILNDLYDFDEGPGNAGPRDYSRELSNASSEAIMKFQPMDIHQKRRNDTEQEESEEEVLIMSEPLQKQTNVEDEDEENYEFDDADVMQENTAQGNGTKKHMYEDELTKVIVAIGSTKLTYGEARLYGLIDAEGSLRLDKPMKKGNNRKTASPQRLHALASVPVKAPIVVTEEEAELTFKPSKPKAAQRAMLNPRCGYDFVSRLNEKHDFLERAFSKSESSKAKRLQLETEKQDYEARLDKLQCPKCRKYQSFDEYYEKRRSCTNCKERYVKLNVLNLQTWEKKQAKEQEKRQERLQKIEEEMYQDMQFKPAIHPYKTTKPRESVVTSQPKTTATLPPPHKAPPAPPGMRIVDHSSLCSLRDL